MDLDVKKSYETKQPENLEHNKFGLKTPQFKVYKERLIKEKRDLELEIMRANKKHETINNIVDLVVKYEDKTSYAE
jgi:hypothetical protein